MEQNNRNEKVPEKGFGGFESLLSDLDSSAMNESARAHAPDDASEQPVPPHRDGQDQHRPHAHHSAGSRGFSASTKQMLAIAFVGVLGLIAVWSGLDETSTGRPYPPATPSANVPTSSQTISEATRDALPGAFPLEVSQPPIGTDHILTPTQLRYCIAEEIRIDAADAVVSNYDAEQVDLFNATVADYNSRCGEFRYRQGSLEAARQSVGRYRSQLEAEGLARFSTLTAGVQQGPSVPTSAVRASFAGTWVGTYSCNQGLTAVRVTLRDDGAGRVRGLFAFSAHESNPYVESGSYLIRGEVSPAGHIVVNGVSWVERPLGYEMVGFSGQVSGSSIAGEIPFGGCTWIRLDRP